MIEITVAHMLPSYAIIYIYSICVVYIYCREHVQYQFYLLAALSQLLGSLMLPTL